jgi:HEPN domain-containing protein
LKLTKVDKIKLVKFWIEGSKKDLQAAEYLILKQKLNAQGLFFLHLALEKILKAIYIKKFTSHAPFTHNLVHLVEKIELELSQKTRDQLAVINEFNLSTRYPSEKAKIEKKFNATFLKKHFAQGKKIYQWLEKLESLTK